MKRIIAFWLVIILTVLGCSCSYYENNNDNNTDTYSNNKEDEEVVSLNDTKLLNGIEDAIYLQSIKATEAEYIVESVETIYISQEYIDEMEFNSQENVFFGYTLSELEEQFEGTAFVFSVDDSGNTNVSKFIPYDNTYEKMIKNVAIGTGVILVCVTLSIATGGAGLTSAQLIFTGAAKGATIGAFSSAAFGVVDGTVTYFETGDVNASLKQAGLSSSENFKWGATLGAIGGGISGGKNVATIKKEADILRNSNIKKAKLLASEIKANGGKPLEGYVGGRTFLNKEGKLPKGVSYKEYDLNKKIQGVGRDALRIVMGDDGTVWFTDDHYETFWKIMEGM